jgi:ABC-type oligopeptide transport system substrate-binding subunit
MSDLLRIRSKAPAFVLVCSILAAGCSSTANTRFFGKTTAPKDNVLRYVSGAEPETLDPQVPDGQPEARIFLALYDGLVDYDPKRCSPSPLSRKAGRSLQASTNIFSISGTTANSATASRSLRRTLSIALDEALHPRPCHGPRTSVTRSCTPRRSTAVRSL